MFTYVKGFTPPDETWQKMKAVHDACTAAGIAVPDEVADFFGYEDPDPAGVETDLPAREWHGQGEAGYELDVAAIPAQCTIIRFFNSW